MRACARVCKCTFVYVCVYVLSPIVIYTQLYTRKATIIHISITRHESDKKCLEYNLPHILNDTPELVWDKIVTHSLRGFACYLKKYQNVCTIYDSYFCQLSIKSH